MAISPPLLFKLTGQVVITVSRSVGGQRIKGAWQDAAPTQIDVKANIQPVISSTDTLFLPEGDRSKVAVKIFTVDELQSRREGTNPLQGDTFVWNGDTYEVRRVISWQMGLLDHYKSIAVRREIT